MPIDASIPLQVQPVKLMSPQEQYAAKSQIEQNMLAKQLGQMKIDDANYQVQRRNKLTDLLSQSYAKPEDREGALLQGGFADEAMKLGKDRRDNMKTDADTADKVFDTNKKKLGVIGSVFGRVAQNPTLQSANEALDYLSMTGMFPPEQIETWRKNAVANPASIKPFAEQAYTSAIEADKQLTAKLTAARDAESARHNKASEGIQVRGQNMTDARAREQITAGRAPAGYRFKPDGSLEPIPGGPAMKDKAPTEFQGKSAVFGARAEQADKILSELEGKYSPLAVNAKQSVGNVPLIGGALETTANIVMPANAQKVEQAQRDFVNAVLRQESGASISKSEFDNAIKQYFPQPGDGEEVIRQKAQNRKTAIEGFKNNAGPAAYTANTAGSSNIDALLDKYK